MDRSEDDRYHGGWHDDEIAALISLSVGIRVRAGNPTRRFDLANDPKGTPIAWGYKKDPTLPAWPRQPVLPSVLGKHALGEAERVSYFAGLAGDAATALIKASRTYQAAVWIAEADPSLAWVLLVSALETAAQFWRQSKDTPVEQIRVARPDVYEKLAAVSDEHLEDIAKLMADYMGATKKFVDFTIEFLPDPPSKRPHENLQFSFEHTHVKAAMKRVYGYRSAALHSGKPFPWPMCEPPTPMKEGEAPVEIPPGLAAQTMGGTWLRKDTPLMLNTFEYIARGALLNWWTTLRSE